MSLFEETTGTQPNPTYAFNSFRFAAWARSWGGSWRNSWGFTNPSPFPGTTNAPSDPFESNSGSGGTQFIETSGTQPDNPFEEN